MSKVKKIVFFTVLSVLILSFAIMSLGYVNTLLYNLRNFYNSQNYGFPTYLVTTRIIFILLYITTDAFLIFILVSAIKNTRLPNFTRYTYEEYKAYRDKKKAENQEKKKAKLQKQLQEIEKTE